MNGENPPQNAAAQDLRGIAANTARDLVLSLRLASRRIEGFEPGQGKDAARELAEQLSSSARRAVELYYLESLTQAVAISEGPVELRRKYDPEAFEKQELFDIQKLKTEVAGCYNKVGFTLLLECELERARRRQLPVSVAIFKLKEPNDVVVQELARQGRECCRLLDVVGLFGLRAVAMLLPDTGHQGADVAVQRVTASYHSSLGRPPGAGGRHDLLIGIASCPEDGYDPGAVLRLADERAGGDSVISNQ